MSDLIKSLRDLAAAKHSDISLASDAADEVERLRAEVERLRRESKRLRAERDTLLLDTNDFVGWFSAHYPDPSTHPDHPWCVINDRLHAFFADTLAALDASTTKSDKENER